MAVCNEARRIDSGQVAYLGVHVQSNRLVKMRNRIPGANQGLHSRHRVLDEIDSYVGCARCTTMYMVDVHMK